MHTYLIRFILLVFAIGMLASTSHAKCKSDLDDRWYVTPGISYIFADNERLADNDVGFNLGVGKALNHCWNFELNGIYDKLDLDSGVGDYNQFGFTADALMFFSRKPSLAPYALAGVGLMRTSSLGVADINPLINVGLGAMRTFTDSGIGARLEARYRIDYDDRTIPTQEHFHDWQIGLSLVVPLGQKKAKMMAAAPVEEKMPPADDDNDGVVNSEDQCPDTPGGVKVNRKGCELDSDRDGVKDSVDRCPGSPQGVKVDMKGCEIKDIISLKGVTFATNSAQLEGNSTLILDEAAATLNKHSGLQVQVAGHTDNTGAASYNRGLSQRRAESVRHYLVEHGVAADRLTAKGYGPDEPVADNSTVEGRSQNRRVELRIQN